MSPLKPRNRNLLIAVGDCPRERGVIQGIKQTMTCGRVEAIDDTPRPIELEGWVLVGDIVYIRGEALIIKIDGDKERLFVHESQVVSVVRGVTNFVIQDQISNKIVKAPPGGIEISQ